MEHSRTISISACPSSPSLERRERLIVIAIFHLAALIKISYLAFGPVLSKTVWSDMSVYVNIADMINDHKWQENHFFQSIGYPLIISYFKKLGSSWGSYLGLLQTCCSFLTLIFMYLITAQQFGKRVGMITIFLGSVHFPWIFYSSVALPEVIFTFFLSLVAWLSVKIIEHENHAWWALAGWGLSFLAAFWLKGTHVFLAPFFLGGLFLIKKRLSSSISIGLLLLLGIGAHGLLTYNTIGKIQLSASTGGLNFIEGKCPLKKNRDSIGYSWQSPLYFQLDLHEEKTWGRPFTDSRYFFKEGLRCIQRQPFVLLQSFESIPYLFIGNTLWPFNQLSMAAPMRLYELFFGIFSITGLIFFFLRFIYGERDPNTFLIWMIPVLSLFVCVYIFKSEVRYRVPFDLWLIPISVKGWHDLLREQRIKHMK